MSQGIEDKLDSIICGDNCEVMRTMPSESIDLVVTSPPYDDLRTYGGHDWDFYGVAWNLKRLLKPGGVIVWNVNDATKNGSETGSSMRQALHFQSIGLNLHDTMIFQRKTKPLTHNRYEQEFEFVFVLSKGKPNTFGGLKKKAATAGQVVNAIHHRNGDVKDCRSTKSVTPEMVLRGNIWKYDVGGSSEASKHPATFPESLARDHILSWSNEGDIVMDPFSGSGTTAKMAKHNGRKYIGIEVSQSYCAIAENRLSQDVLF